MLNKNKLLLVEGKDEINFFQALCSHLSIDDIQIIETGGKEKLKSEFPAVLLMRNFESVVSIAVIQDADISLISTVDSIKYLLSKHNLPVPEGHTAFKTTSGMKSGIFIMPGNRDSGMLENLVLDTLDGNLVKIESDKYIDALREKLTDHDTPRFPRNEHKARLYAYLAGMEKHVSSLGLATQKGYFNLDSEYLDEIKTFLRSI
jgi:hypothetical protein